MSKQLTDMRIVVNKKLGELYTLMVLSTLDFRTLPEIEPGQFVQVEVPDSKNTFLRRPISINWVSKDKREIHLLIRKAGNGTRKLSELSEGTIINVLLPLGNGFPMDEVKGKRVLLIGGGVGVAPLLYYGEKLKIAGAEPIFLLGARSAEDLLLVSTFQSIAPVCLSTEDGSLGAKGFVTENPAMNKNFDFWAVCGPAPMMKAVASKAREFGVECHVSLENMMACGLGACLCCVEKTVKGNVCVCTHGPVFNINDLTW